MTVRGTADEIKEAVKGLAPAWPIHLIDSLVPGEWHFVLNSIDVLVIVEDAKEEPITIAHIIQCKDCVHRPIRLLDPGTGPQVIEPCDEKGRTDETCPHLCDDPWYNKEPEDDWFCNFGERKQPDDKPVQQVP